MRLDFDEVEALMAEKFMSREDLGQLLSCTRAGATDLLRGIKEGRNILPPTAGKLAKALGVPVRQIQKRTDSDAGPAPTVTSEPKRPPKSSTESKPAPGARR